MLYKTKLDHTLRELFGSSGKKKKKPSADPVSKSLPRHRVKTRKCGRQQRGKKRGRGFIN